MANIPKGNWIGMVDIHGREIIFVDKNQDIPTSNFSLVIILNKKGNLEIQKIREVVEVVYGGKVTVVFQGIDMTSFSLKGGGKTYFGKGEVVTNDSYKMDYDNFGNLIYTKFNRSKTSDPKIFLTRLWVFSIRRKREQLRRKRKESIIMRKKQYEIR